VRCARCRKWIVATAMKRPEWGVNFQGEAQAYGSYQEFTARHSPR
jgi:hypothetical protein